MPCIRGKNLKFSIPTTSYSFTTVLYAHLSWAQRPAEQCGSTQNDCEDFWVGKHTNLYEYAG